MEEKESLWNQMSPVSVAMRKVILKVSALEEYRMDLASLPEENN